MQKYTHGLAEVGAWHIHCGLIPLAQIQVVYLLQKLGSAVITVRHSHVLHNKSSTRSSISTLLSFY